MTSDPLVLDRYTLRRKVFKIFGAGFYILDPQAILIGYSAQKAFKLKEDIRLFADEAQTVLILSIKARQMIDFAACYDIVDERDGKRVGAARRRGFSSFVRDSWELLDENDAPIAHLQEDSLGLALLRRLLSGLIPQRFHIGAGAQAIQIHQRLNPFIYKLDVSIPPDSELDRRLILAMVVLLAAIEGRQG